MAELAVPANDGGPFDHNAVLDHRSFPDKDLFPNESTALTTIMQTGTDIGIDVSG
jgi:hypothetical protein